MYPKIILNYQKLVHNTKTLTELCHSANITVMGVTKAMCAWEEAVEAYVEGGVDYLADSRIENLKVNSKVLKVLLRLPQLEQCREVVKYADISLNSSLITIEKLNSEAKSQNKVHKIIFMFDLGDLREGIYYSDDYLETIKKVYSLSNIELLGIGTNLTCYGGVIPTKETLQKLEKIGKNIETTLQIDLKLKSFGNSSSIYLLDNASEYNYFNNLRLGEALILGRETSYGEKIENTHEDVFKLQAQLVEVYNKPSLPEGELGMNAFGEKVTFEDKGMMKRGILAIGRQDVNVDDIIPVDKGITIIGSSSDHMIIDLTNTDYELGDIIEFNLTYGSILSLTTSKYISREVTYEKGN